MNWNDKEQVLEAVKNKGLALKYASIRIKYDLNLLRQIYYESFPASLTQLHYSYNIVEEI